MKTLLSGICLLFSSYSFSQKVTTAQMPKTDHDYYILSLPSTECTNCKASTPLILDYFKKHKGTDSLVILTDNDAGLYYLDESPYFDKALFPVVVNEKLTSKLSPNGKASLSFCYSDIAKTTELNGEPVNLIERINPNKSQPRNGNYLEPFRTDSVHLKYNIFGYYGNSIIESSDNNYFLYSKKDNAGCWLIPKDGDTSKASLEHTKLDSGYYNILAAKFDRPPYMNISQDVIRDFSSRSGIPLSKIYGLDRTSSDLYAYFSFFTGRGDTIRTTKNDSVSISLKYNLGIAKRKLSGLSKPVELNKYEEVAQIDSFTFHDVPYNISTLISMCTGDDGSCYIAASPRQPNNTIFDSLFYVAKYKFGTKGIQRPAAVLSYPYGNFGHDCMIRCAKNSAPIVVNKAKGIIDFGAGKSPIYLKDLRLLNDKTDTLTYIYDCKPMNDGSLKLIAFSNKEQTIVATINKDGKLNEVTVLDIPVPPFFCEYLHDGQIIATYSKGRTLITKQYKLHS